MVKISIPTNAPAPYIKSKFFSFSVHAHSIMFAGSRNLTLKPELCQSLVSRLYETGFHFFVGCAPGVDRCFRQALAHTPFDKRTFVACAFHKRTGKETNYGLDANVVVPENLNPATALVRRTIWMVRRCQILFLFPDDPLTNSWGKGSTLAFNAAAYNLKPVFLISQ